MESGILELFDTFGYGNSSFNLFNNWLSIHFYN